MPKVLIATVKPFSAQAVEEVRDVFKEAGYEYDDEELELLEAVAEGWVNQVVVR